MFDLNICVLMLNLNSNGRYEYVATSTDGDLPSLPIKENITDIETVTHSYLQYFIGEPTFSENFVLHNVTIKDHQINIYYYIFLPWGINLINGHFTDLEKIKDVSLYQKIIQKIT